MIGTSLTHYRLTAKLGAGGMGEVYRATDTKLGREVAIKVLPEQFSESRESVARFEREAKVLASLDHPNIAAIYGFEQANDTRFLVLQLVEGETLAERLQRGSLPVRTALEVCRQIAEALEAAHEKGVIHRDLKPANVKITPDGKVKVLDFGIAKGLLDEPSAPKNTAAEDTPTVLTASTRPGAILGTPAYMSPEQARGEIVDKRSDIWSFGCVLYECLSRTKLFAAETPIDSLYAVLHKDPDWSALPAGTPASIQHMLQRCLDRDRNQRLRDIRDASLEIAAAISEPVSLSSTIGRAVAGVTSGPRAKPVGHSKKRFFPATLAAAGILVIATVSWWAFHRSSLPPESKSPSQSKSPNQAARVSGGESLAASQRIGSLLVLPLRNFASDTNQDFFVDGITDLLIGELSHISGLEVKSLTTAMNYKGTKKSVPEIGRELRVDAVVEGSVQREGDQVLVNVQLIETKTDRHLWRNKYDREMKNVLKMKSELAEAIAAEIQVKLTPQEQTRLASTRQRNPEAVENYLKGRHFLNGSELSDLSASTNYFQRALQIEQDYAEAYAGLAGAYLSMSTIFVAPRQVMPLARTNALKALQLDDNLAEAHQQLGNIHLLFDYDFRAAQKEYQRALALNPNFAGAHDGLAMLLQTQGKHQEAIAQDETAFRLDPLSQFIGANFVGTLLIARHYERAIRQATDVLLLQKDNHMAACWMGFAYAQSGNPRSAIAKVEPICGLKDRPPMLLASLAYAYAVANEKENARRRLVELEQIARQQYVCVYEIATVYVALGEYDTALDWLYKALDARADCIPFTNVDPRLDPLRSLPRFKQLLQDIGF